MDQKLLCKLRTPAKGGCCGSGRKASTVYAIVFVDESGELSFSRTYTNYLTMTRRESLWKGTTAALNTAQLAKVRAYFKGYKIILGEDT